MWGHHHHHGMWDNYDIMGHMIYDHHHHHGMYDGYYHYPGVFSTTVPGHVMTPPQVIYVQQPMATYQTVPQQVIMAQPSQTVIAQPVAQAVVPSVSQTLAQEADRQGIMRQADTVYAPVVSSRDIQAPVQLPRVVVGPRVIRRKKPTCCC